MIVFIFLRYDLYVKVFCFGEIGIIFYFNVINLDFLCIYFLWVFVFFEFWYIWEYGVGNVWYFMFVKVYIYFKIVIV